MFFNQALQGPIVIEIDGSKISIPKFTLDDFAAWGAELDGQREDRLTKGMEAEQRFHYLAFYNVLPHDLGDLRRMVRTAGGVKRILSTCLRQATVTARGGVDLPTPEPLQPSFAESILRRCTPRDQELLAVKLADVEDARQIIQQRQAAQADQADNDSSDFGQEGAQSPLQRTPTTTSTA